MQQQTHPNLYPLTGDDLPKPACANARGFGARADINHMQRLTTIYARFGNGQNTVSEHRAQWVFWSSPSSGDRTQWGPLSLLFVCQSELTEFFAELTEFAAELSEFSLPRQYSRNSIPPVSYRFLAVLFLLSLVGFGLKSAPTRRVTPATPEEQMSSKTLSRRALAYLLAPSRWAGDAPRPRVKIKLSETRDCPWL